MLAVCFFLFYLLLFHRNEIARMTFCNSDSGILHKFDLNIENYRYSDDTREYDMTKYIYICRAYVDMT